MKDKINTLLQANQARNKQQYEEAIDYYMQYLRKYHNPDVMHVLALIYFRLDIEQPGRSGRGQEAIEWIDKAIAQESTNAEFHATRGDIFNYGLDMPNYEEAAKNYRTALQLRPDLVNAHLGLASLEGVPDEVVSLPEAIVSVQKASQVQPENPNIFLRLGTLYFQAGKESEALEAYECALLKSQPISLQNAVEIFQRIS